MIMKNPIAVYKFSLARQIKFFVILLVVAALFFIWWLEIKDLSIFLVPVGFLFVFISIFLAYAWITKEKSAIKVFESGIYLENQFISWMDVKTVELIKTDIDTITNRLLVSKIDGSQLETSLDFKNEKSDVIFRFVLDAFERYS